MNFKRNLYWNKFYSNFSFSKESNFAKFCLKYIKKNSDLLDIACGNGRDTFFFIKSGIKCQGIDISILAATKYISGHADNMLGLITVKNEKLFLQI